MRVVSTSSLLWIAVSFVLTLTAVDANDGYALELADKLQIHIEMNENFDHGVDCSLADWQLCYTKTLLIDYTGDEDYTENDFKIYFSSIHRVLDVDHPDFEHNHVIGDLTYIAPTTTFSGFSPMSKTAIPLVYEYWSVQATDNMPRWFVVDERDNSTAIIANTDTEDMQSFTVPYDSTMKTATDNNIPMTASNRYAANTKTEEVDASTRIIPSPYKTVVADDAQTFEINGVSLDNEQILGNLKVADLLSKLGVSEDGDHQVSFVMDGSAVPADVYGPAEAYMMEITTQGTTITAADEVGLFNGFMSFIALLDVNTSNSMTLKEMTVHDMPRFSYRGHQVDTARNFRSKQTILNTIDAMALWKLNVMHLALTNDEGWRLEIPGLPELTSVGSKRCFDLDEQTCLLTQLGSGPDVNEGFYSRDDYIDILQYAKERNVKVIPEFNMPAHARAAVISMEARAKNGDDTYRLTDPEDETYLLTVQFYDRTSIINPCLDSSVRFIEKLVQEVKSMHDDAGVPLDSYHFGGDEAKNILLGNGYSSYPEDLKQKPFSKSPACAAKGLNTDDSAALKKNWTLTVNDILAENGIGEMLAWYDGVRGTTADEYETGIATNFWDTLFWGGIDSLASIDPDMGIILSSPDYLYFDFPYEVNPDERGYYWGTRFNSVYKVFTYAPENLPQMAEVSMDRDGNEMNLVTPDATMPNIRGMQGQTWSETIRTDDQYGEMAFPRAISVAERAWHKASWELDWTPGASYNMATGLVPKDKLAEDYNGFVSVLGCREVLKLEKLGITYRVPPPGAVISLGTLSANSELPCTPIMYSIDQGDTWLPYSSPVNVGVGQVVHLKSMSADGTRESRVVEAETTLAQDPALPFTGQVEDDSSADTFAGQVEDDSSAVADTPEDTITPPLTDGLFSKTSKAETASKSKAEKASTPSSSSKSGKAMIQSGKSKKEAVEAETTLPPPSTDILFSKVSKAETAPKAEKASTPSSSSKSGKAASKTAKRHLRSAATQQ